MLAISRASDKQDFEIIAAFCSAFGEWDAAEGQAHGIPPEVVTGIFHGHDSNSLADRFKGEEANLFIARWNGSPAGCLGFDTFDDTSLELQKFYVDPDLRGKGIGSALMQTVLSAAAARGHSRLVLHTAIYMKNAVAIYRSFGFEPCPQFRQIPDSIKHTEVFMSRAL